MNLREYLVCDVCDKPILDNEAYEFKKIIYCSKCAVLFARNEQEKGNQVPVFKGIKFDRK